MANSILHDFRSPVTSIQLALGVDQQTRRRRIHPAGRRDHQPPAPAHGLHGGGGAGIRPRRDPAGPAPGVPAGTFCGPDLPQCGHDPPCRHHRAGPRRQPERRAGSRPDDPGAAKSPEQRHRGHRPRQGRRHHADRAAPRAARARSPCATTAPASPRSSGARSFSPSPPTARKAAPASGWRLPRASSTPTAARSPSSRRRAPAPPSASACRCRHERADPTGSCAR